MKGRRKHNRFNINVEATIILENHIKHSCILKDISKKAVMILTQTYLKKGDIFTLQFDYNDEPYTFKCRVIRTINLAKEVGAELVKPNIFDLEKLFKDITNDNL